MTEVREFTFSSSDGRSSLHGMEWRPTDREPVAVLQLVHGVADHIARYDDFARFLNGHGILVAGHDHLGHGGSVPEGGVPFYFGDGADWKTVTDDVRLLHEQLRERYPALPMLLLGHSMGSFLARSYLIRYPGTVQAAVIMGTGWQGELTLAEGRLLAGLACAVRGAAGTSRLVTKLAFGSYNSCFREKRTSHDWLSADTDNVDRYLADPMCQGQVTVGLFRQMLRGIRFNQAWRNMDKMDPDTPLLLISGAQDPVGDMGAGVRRTHDSFRRCGVQDMTVKLYPGLRHEILNEGEARLQVYEDILQWLEEKLRPQGAE